MNEVVLLILFNHNYEKNIERLEALYKSRFSNLYFIMPFYEGNKDNVLPVYENSFYFQGYIAQALKQIKEKTFGHYLIIGDDLILNPRINETNFKAYFKLDADSGFIPKPFLINDVKEKGPFRPFAPIWGHERSAINFSIAQKGIEVSRYLPSYEDANNKLKNHGVDFTSKIPARMFIPKPLFKSGDSSRKNLKRLSLVFENLKYIIFPPNVPYPIVGSYSDIVVLPNKHKEKFILYAGVFSALKLFVEMAIPTALLYAVPKVVQEKDLELKGHTYWGIDDFNALEAKYKGSLTYLFENFPEDCLYIHPIKLSRWK
jgi:hypothetical protein